MTLLRKRLEIRQFSTSARVNSPIKPVYSPDMELVRGRSKLDFNKNALYRVQKILLDENTSLEQKQMQIEILLINSTINYNKENEKSSFSINYSKKTTDYVDDKLYNLCQHLDRHCKNKQLQDKNNPGRNKNSQAYKIELLNYKLITTIGKVCISEYLVSF